MKKKDNYRLPRVGEIDVVYGVNRGNLKDVMHEPNLDTARVSGLCPIHARQSFLVSSPKVVATNKDHWFTVYCPSCLKRSAVGKQPPYHGHKAKLRLTLKLEPSPK